MAEGAPDYFKRILLYGLYEGVATPLACDEQGRLIFIPEKVSPFTKSGTVVMRETFDEGLVHLIAGGEGTGNAVAADSTEVKEGGYSCKLTGGSDALRRASIKHYFHPSAFNKLAIEWSISWGADVELFSVTTLVYTGTHSYQGSVRYDPAADKWEVYDYGELEWTAILESVNYGTAVNDFHTFKLVLDIPSGTYSSFVHATKAIDLSAYQLEELVSAAVPYQMTIFVVKSTDGNNGVVYLDDIIFTQDES